VLAALPALALLVPAVLPASRHLDHAAPAAATGPTGAPPARYAVGVQLAQVIDPFRWTPARGTTPAHIGRILNTAYWYPTAGTPSGADNPFAAPVRGQFPLVVFAHGFDTNAATYRVLLHDIAAAGYVVAAPEFPISGIDGSGPAREDDNINQPADLSAVITATTHWAGLAGNWLNGTVDVSRIAAVGHSDGGSTVAAMTLNSGYNDSRVKAAVVLAGAEMPMPGGRYGVKATVPLLVEQGDHDPYNGYGYGYAVFADAHGPKAMLTTIGGLHITPVIGSGTQPELVRACVVAFLDTQLRNSTEAFWTLAADGNVAGVTRLSFAGG
jgi:dienelactone hydrolase